MTQIELYDATLRDGMGGGGMSLTAEEKVRLVHRLDDLGVHLVEAGFPASNPKEAELFALLEHEPLAEATIAAFGMTRRRGIAADEVFMTGTAAELVPVREIDDHTIGGGKPGALTQAVQTAFDDALHARGERYREWLDPVPARAEAKVA